MRAAAPDSTADQEESQVTASDDPPVSEEIDRPDESRIRRGDPRAGIFEPRDPFDPEQFNRRYHGSPAGSITFGSAN